jgi:hypothetical protein
MQNPNPGRYFTYSVRAGVSGGGGPPYFDAIATRRNTTNNPGGQFNGTITLDETGTYGGDHPLRPVN